MLLDFSFQSDQQKGRRQSGIVTIRGHIVYVPFLLETIVPVAPSSNTMNGSPRCWEAFPSSITHEDSFMTAWGLLY